MSIQQSEKSLGSSNVRKCLLSIEPIPIEIEYISGHPL